MSEQEQDRGMGPERQQRISEMLHERGATRPCLLCGSTEVYVGPYYGLIPLVQYADQGLDEPARKPQVVAMLVCRNCAFISMIGVKAFDVPEVPKA